MRMKVSKMRSKPNDIPQREAVPRSSPEWCDCNTCVLKKYDDNERCRKATDTINCNHDTRFMGQKLHTLDRETKKWMRELR